ncbi:hypothetical protein PBAL39_00370 [Pedobacter sp. BAL39]|nr:hypothetical protein PBAL39_00370 [Pedobacter sp. BAL39]
MVRYPAAGMFRIITGNMMGMVKADHNNGRCRVSFEVNVVYKAVDLVVAYLIIGNIFGEIQVNPQI